MMQLKRAVLAFWCATWILVAHAAAADETADAAQLDRLFRRTTLQISTPSARVHTFNVWIADDFNRRARGLMFVKQLADDAGMLFIYEQPQEIGMWMKNTFIPLDMLFVDSTGKVIRVAENTVPHSLDTISSHGLALGVIELKGGTAKRLGIGAGARVSHPVFRASN
jgi:uncharacterized membrane protein (UPF0127 family)